MLTYGKGSDSEKRREVELKQSDNWKLQCFFSARFVDVARNYILSFFLMNCWTIVFKKKMENFKKVGVACTRLSPLSLYSKNSPQLCILLNPSLLDLKTFRSCQVALPALPASEAGGLGSREDKHN